MCAVEFVTDQTTKTPSTIIGCVTTIINYFAPEKLFSFLLATSGAVALLVYLVIAVSQLRMRKKLLSHGRTLGFKMWLYPGLTWAVIVFIVGALGVMGSPSCVSV
jgi:GABA permease